MTPTSVILRKLSCLFILVLALVCSATAAYATTGSVSVSSDPSGGVLNYTETSSIVTCGQTDTHRPAKGTLYSFSNFNYVANGSTYPLFGQASEIKICGGDEDWDGPEISPAVMTDPISSSCTITFTPNGVSGHAVLSCSGFQGYINPKYVVVGVTYAPPGTSSFVEYTNTTSVGNTVAIGQSFTNNVGFSVSVSKGFGIPEGGIVQGGAGVKLTVTSSTDYTEGSNSSTTTTISKASTVSYTTPGTPTFSPVNSDYDYIWIWLNPELLFTVTPASGNTNASIQWNGYAFDGNDPASGLPPVSGPYYGGPDVVEVQVGCLNGHFSCPSTLTWLNGVEGTGSYVSSGLLARSWASSANGYQWPSGEVAGLTFSDVCQILTFDPLASTPSQCVVQNDYTQLNSLPSTTLDGRFTKLPYPPNVIQYPVGGGTELYSTVQTNTQSVASGTTNTIKQAFSISEQFGGSFFGLFSSTTTLTQSQTLTWNYTYLDTLTTTNTLTNELSITGPPDPPPPYNGPVEFIGYQDNMFGTFVFVPL